MKSPRFARPLWLSFALVGCFLALSYGPLSRMRAASNVPVRVISNSAPLGQLQNQRNLTAVYTGAAGDIAALQSAKPTGLIQADFDNDGAPDLVAGYSTAHGGLITLQRGNPDAFAPKNQSLYAAALKGKVPPTYMPAAAIFAVPESPDFLAVGDFNGDGFKDLLVGTNGGNLYLLEGDGRGNLGSARSISIPGQVTALAVSGGHDVAVASAGSSGPTLSIFTAGAGGLTPVVTYVLPASGSSMEWGRLGINTSDLAVAAGNSIVLFYNALDVNGPRETIDLAYHVQALSIGDFTWDRDGRKEIAALGDDGTVHILEHGTLDTRPLTQAEIPGRRALAIALAHKPPQDPTTLGAWAEAEQKQTAGAVSSTAGVSPQARLQISRLGASAGRGLMVLDAAQSQINVVDPSASARPQPAIALKGTPVAALATPQKLNGRRELVVLTAGQAAPVVISEAPSSIDPAVNTTADTDGQNACTNPSVTASGLTGTISLRTAVCAVNNSGAGSYTISVPAGTYNLSDTTQGGNGLGTSSGELQVGTTAGSTISIVGSATAATTIIHQTNNVDRVIEQDPNVVGLNLSVSNITLSGGTTTNSGQDGGYGGGAILGGSGQNQGDLSLTNAVLTGNTAGLKSVGTGDAGGGVNYSANGTFTVSNTTFSSNTATAETGGGIDFLLNPSSGSLSVTNSYFTGNQSTAGSLPGQGGAIYASLPTGTSASISGSTFTGNTAAGSPGQGGAIFSTGTTSLSNSRIVGNTATQGSGFYQSSGGGNATIVDNWWGCNAGPNNTGCDQVGGAGTATFNPWLVLSISASSNEILPSGTTTLTADLTHNSNGTGGSSVPNADTADGFTGTPVAFGGTFDASVTQPGVFTSGQANSTFTAVNTAPHTGSGTATVDNQQVSVTIYIVAPPSISKTFGTASIAVGGATSLSFTVSNPNPSPVTLNGIGFTDSLPSGLAVSNPNGESGSCGGGAITATASSTSVSLSGASLGGGGSCTFSVNVTASSAGTKNNTTGNVSSSNGGTGSTASASIDVFAPPTISKAFGAPSIPMNGSTTLTFTITTPASNPTSNLSGISFTDTLPAGLVVSTPNGEAGSCGSGTITATAGSGSVSLSGASLGAGATCTFSVNVSGVAAGTQNNSVTVTSTQAGSGNTSTASVVVIGPPSISKAFVPSTVPLGNDAEVTFTITNPNSVSGLSNVAFSDTLPSGLQVASSPGVTNSCNGSVTAAANSGTISLSGGTLSTSGSCAITVNVIGATATTYNNQTSTVSSTEGGSGPASNIATLTVQTPSCYTPPANMIDWFPGEGNGNDIAGPNNLTAQNGAGFTTGEVGQAFNFQNPTNDASGQYFQNATPTGLPVGNSARTIDFWFNSGTDLTTSTEAALIEYGTQTAEKTFGLIFSGNAPGKLYFYGNSDDLAGTTTIAPNTWYHAAVTYDGSHLVLYVNGAAEASKATSSLNTVLDANGLTLGLRPGSSSWNGQIDEVEIFSRALTATEINNLYLAGSAGKCKSTATISKSFTPSTIQPGANSTLSFTITNPNAEVNLTGISFTDNLPAGITVAPSAVVTNSCNGTATASGGTVSLSGGTLAGGASSTCTLSVPVTGSSPGAFDNTTGAISTNEAGTGTTSNTARLTIIAPPSIAKAFSPTAITLNSTTSLTFTITNPAGNTVALNGVAFTDTLPTGLTVASSTGPMCGGTLTTTSPTTISLSGATIATTSQCQFSVTVTGAVSGTYTNVTGNVTSTNGGTGNTASAGLTVGSPPTIQKSFGAATIPLSGTTTLSFTITNPSANTTSVTGVGFTDTLPAGLVVSTPNGLTGTCDGGTITATAGSGSVSLSGATLSAGSGPIHSNLKPEPATSAVISKKGSSSPISNVPTTSSCTFSVNVTGTTTGAKTNNVTVNSDQGTGNTSTATVDVDAAPTFSKAFGAPSIPLNGSTSLTFTITNPNSTNTMTGIGFTDTLPAGLVISTPNGLTGACGAGTITATQGTSTITLSNGNVAISGSCTFSANVTGTTAGDKNNTTGNITSTEGGTGSTASASTTVVSPPSIAKAFSPSSIALNGTTSLTFTITNPSANAVSETGVGFTDTLPTGLTLTGPNSSFGECGGNLTTIGPTYIALSGATIAANGQCQFSVTVTGTASGSYTNTTGNVSSTNGGTGNTASANLSVATPPTIQKSFGAATIPVNGSTSLSFTITNPSTTNSLTGVGFTDTLPMGMVVSTPNGLTGSCDGGTITATAGSGTVSLSGATLTAGSGPVHQSLTRELRTNESRSSESKTAGVRTNGSAAGNTCTFSVNITGTTAGVLSNSVTATSNEGGSGNTSTASVTVVSPPGISKAFGVPSIPLNGTTSLTFTITNSNSSTTLTGVAFSDTLPAGLVVATPNGLTSSCYGGTVTATPGATVISLSGASLASSSNCSISVNVTGTTAGTKNNITGNVTSMEGGTGGTASASTTVVAPPSIAKAFTPSTIALNGTTSLTFTITNPSANTVSEVGVAFTDTLPTGLTVATSSAAECGGTLTTTSPTNIALSGASVAANSQCQFSVTVTGAASGSYTNTTGSVTSTNGGTGNTASASLSVATPPSIQKSFGAATIPLNGSTSLTFTITNPSTTNSLTGVGFTDTLPMGMVVSTPNGETGSCDGGTITAAAGSGTVSLSGATLTAGSGPVHQSLTSESRTSGSRATPARSSGARTNGPTSGNTCTFSVNITGTTAGVLSNSVTATSNEGGSGNTSTASVTVVSPPGISKAFGAPSVPLNGTTSLTFTITNSNSSTTLDGIAFSDTLPAGLVVATPNGLAGTCGGTVTATSGAGVISLSGGSVASSSNCSISVNVTGTTAGTKNNITGNVRSTEGGTGGTASASVVVVAPPSIAKAFNPTTIALNGTTSLTFTITNPSANSATLTGVAFTDTLPTGLTIASSSIAECGGTLTTTSPTTIALSGASVAANSQCQFSVTVTGAVSGSYTNTTGNVTSTNGGTGNTASAGLRVGTPPTITKAFSPSSIPVGGTSTLTFTIRNSTSIPQTGVTFSDSLPAGMKVASSPHATNTCGGTFSAAANSTTVGLGGGTVGANTSCSLSVKVTGTTAGVLNNTTGAISSTQGGTGTTSNTAALTVIAPPTIKKFFGASSIPLNGSTTLGFTVGNPNSTTTLTHIEFSDYLPSGLVVSTPNGLSGSCHSGTISASNGADEVSLSGATLAPGASCTFYVKVTGTAAGTKNNVTGAISSNECQTGGTASATLTVVKPPTLSKSFGASSIPIDTKTKLIFTVTNPAANTVPVTGIGFTDPLPAGLIVSTPNELTGSCGGATITANSGSSMVSFSGATLDPAHSCTVTLKVTATTNGPYHNVTSPITSTNGGTGTSATATLSVSH